jgi:subfamily B ATP-binding cassette protein MsbA
MSPSQTFKRIMRLLIPHKSRILIALAGMVLTAATEPAMAGLMKLLLDKGFAGPRTFSLWLVPLFVVGVFVIRGISTFTTNYMMAWVSSRLMTDLRQSMFERLLEVPLGFYGEQSVGTVINAMMLEVQQILEMIRSVLVTLIRDTLTVCGLLGYLFWLNWICIVFILM